jgi:hypothetical protein
MLSKAERPWWTLRDNAFALMHSMSVPNSMWSRAISTVVYLRNRMFSRTVGVSVGVPLTLLTSLEPDASKFRVFGGSVFAKVPNKLSRKFGEKAFRGIMVGYLPDAPGYRIYNPATRRITTLVHVVFQENVPGSPPSLTVDSLICDDPELDSDRGSTPQSHPLHIDPRADEELHLDPHVVATAPPLLDHDRPSRLRFHPIRHGELVAHLSDHPRVFVATCYDPEEGQTHRGQRRASRHGDTHHLPPASLCGCDAA